MIRNLIILAVCLVLAILFGIFPNDKDIAVIILLTFAFFGAAMLVTVIVKGIRDLVKTKKFSVGYFIIFAVCLLLVFLTGIFYANRNILGFKNIPVIVVLTLGLFGLVMLVILIVKGIRDLVKTKKKPDTEKA